MKGRAVSGPLSASLTLWILVVCLFDIREFSEGNKGRGRPSGQVIFMPQEQWQSYHFKNPHMTCSLCILIVFVLVILTSWRGWVIWETDSQKPLPEFDAICCYFFPADYAHCVLCACRPNMFCSSKQKMCVVEVYCSSSNTVSEFCLMEPIYL